MIQRIALLLLLDLLGHAMMGCGAETTDGAHLLAHVQMQQEMAKAQLAEFRKKRDRERVELAAKLQAAFEALRSAELRRDHAKRVLDDQDKRQISWHHEEHLRQRQTAAFTQQFNALLPASLDQSATREEIVAAVWSILESRLHTFAAARLIVVREHAVIARDGSAVELPVLHVGRVESIALGKTQQTQGALVMAESGSLRVAGPLYSGLQTRALSAVKAGRSDLLPLDPSMRVIDQTAQLRLTWSDWLASGGLFVYPIMLVGLAGMVLMAERGVYLSRTTLTPMALNKLRQQLNTEKAPTTTLSSEMPEERLARIALVQCSLPLPERESGMEAALLAEEPRLSRSLSVLGALAGVAPLLGLLGTVSGMIHTFADLARVGAGNAQVLSGGISEALITTQLGLMVAVPLLLGHAWLNRSVERRGFALEQWAMELLHFGVGIDKEDANDS